MNTEELEIKRALDIYFQEQFGLQRQIVKQLASIEGQNRVLLAIFAAAGQELGK